MPQPYDYLGMMGGAANIGGIHEAVQNALLGEQQRRQNENLLAKQSMEMEAARRAEEQKAQLQVELADLSNNLTPDNLGRFMVRNPSFHEPITQAWRLVRGAQRDAEIKMNADVKGYLDSGRPDLAIKALTDRMTAERSAGQDVSHLQQLADLIREDPKVGRVMADISLAAALGPEHYSSAYGTQRESARKDELQPFAVRRAAAQAGIAEADAEARPEMNAATVNQRNARAANDRRLARKGNTPPRQGGSAAPAAGAPTAIDPRTGQRVRYNARAKQWEPIAR